MALGIVLPGVTWKLMPAHRTAHECQPISMVKRHGTDWLGILLCWHGNHE